MQSTKLALEGGTPVRTQTLPYARQCLDEKDLQAMLQVLRSDWLTTGPNVAAFEEGLTDLTGASEAVSVSSGTAALHTAMAGAQVGPGDEVLVTTMTFVASANCAVYQGATPVFCDVSSDSLLIDPDSVAERISHKTKAVVAVDYTGQPCDYDALKAICEQYGSVLIGDAAHSLGGSYKGRKVGTLADLTAMSFHPAKHITTGEGGAVLAEDPEAAKRMRSFRNHGIDLDLKQRAAKGTWHYEMTSLGYNYRLNDFQCILGLSQLAKLPAWVERRKELAKRYNQAFADMPGLVTLVNAPDRENSQHIYVVKLDLTRLSADRDQIYKALRAEGIGVNVHYTPVHMHPFYRQNFGTKEGTAPRAEQAAKEILTLPLFPLMSDADADDVVMAMDKVLKAYLL
ncbi:UDP-4-amino-4,6-dideoxy-N-acetyl-beta-L-altrosamine transaminase [Dethiosulfatarculus sandiegensis]|uniref:UDP-4-amino-4, 6-dideoxy-N-acetyl-beta-L-altrosamine transaminase n=1 Tax=Dethiosulfatarculus sandiegensis TaxID=1429043 RepID=UPI0005CA6D43|nr:UDP-4-amino-4,6-dideoxy-N-acetyl-beta-L-altrosamine transaminase [Dethiosulfatarculus sandiegensis]